MGNAKSHEDLQVWQMAIDFVTDIYKVAGNFPKFELYGLTNQIRRASVSIPSNIAEGSARRSTKEYIQFLYISLGSVAEVETQLLISKNLGYINDDTLKIQIKYIKGKLINLINSLRKKI